MTPLTPLDKLDELRMTLMCMRTAVRRLEERSDDRDLSPNDRVGLALQLPTLQADLNALETRLVALRANMTTLAPISDPVFLELKSATEQLAEIVARNGMVSALLEATTNLMGMARAATG
jgi:hypothetical protein